MLNDFLTDPVFKMQHLIDYNQRKAESYGWTPEWFGCTDFDSELIDAIKQFQTENGLVADGMCGSGTFRHLFTEREQEREYHGITDNDTVQTIICNEKHIEIFWDKVITWNERGGQQASTGHYSPYVDTNRFRKPQFFVTHWDVCLSSASCFRVLEQRKISVHFGIDNDGTIYQWLDVKDVAFHAGGRSWNHASIGVEVSNAYNLKWQKWYRKHGFGERPIIEDAQCHGKTLSPFLGFYDVQLDALSALWEAVSWACDIPLELPSTSGTVDPQCVSNEFKGFCNHYHLKRSKIDCAGLDDELILSKAKELRKKREQ